MGSDYELIDGEWIASTNVKILMEMQVLVYKLFIGMDGDGLGLIFR